MDSPEQCLICLADKIVFRILGNLKRGYQGVSLEEVLQRVGIGIDLPWQFTKRFQEEWTRRGFAEGLGGIGHGPSHAR